MQEAVRFDMECTMTKRLGCEIANFVYDEDVRERAKKRGVTRSIVSMEKACSDSQIKIFAIVNAPTALFAMFIIFGERSR